MSRTVAITGVALFGAAALIASTPAAAGSLNEQIDAIHRPYSDNPAMPGAIVALLRGGEIAHLKGYGLANREFGIPWDDEVRYTFFSITKSMVAAAFLRLEDQRRVSLDDDMRAYLPDFPAYEHKITIRHLLDHTSGLWQDEDLIRLIGVSMNGKPLSIDEMYEIGKKQPSLPYRPGTHYYYNDAGLRFAGRILSKITGKDFGGALRELVFEPAGMKTASVKPREPMYYPRQAPTYLLDETPGADPARDALMIGTIDVETAGDGGSNGTIRDLIAYARYLSAGYGTGRSLIERLTAKREARGAAPNGYRLSMVEARHRGVTIFYHAGLYGKRIAYLPGFDSWVISMRNALDTERLGNDQYMYALVDALLDQEGIPPAADGTDRARAAAASRIAPFVGRYIEPISGSIYELGMVDALPTIRQFGEETELVAAPGCCDLQTDPLSIGIQAHLSIRGGVLAIQQADWPSFRRLQRIGGDRVGTAGQFAGLYRSTTYGSVQRIEPDGEDALMLSIGAGARLADRIRLRRVSDDLFEGVAESGEFPLTVRFRKTGNGLGMTLTTNTVRGLSFERLENAAAR